MGFGRRSVAYYFDPEVGNFYYAQGHPMKPHRMRMTHNLLVAYGLVEKLDVFTPPRVTEREMTRFHADEYISFLKHITPDTIAENHQTLSRFNVLEDCPVFDGLWEYCQITAGGSLAGAARLNAGEASVAVNWAGGLHHAKKAEASGFCYINDCVLAILELLKVHARVLYIDIDIHHGDGVEEAFYTTDRVMTVSFHKFGGFFPGTGALEDIGSGRGKNYAINFPLRDGIDDDSYREIFIPVMTKVMAWYVPGAVVLQCGADSLTGDRLGCFNLSLRGHAQCVDFLKRYDVPLLLLGGGGYTIRNVARCWAYETSRVLWTELTDDLPYNENLEFYAPEFRLHIVPSNMENHNTRAELEANKIRILEHMRGFPAVPSIPMIDVPRSSPLGVHVRDVDSDLEDPDTRHHSRTAKSVIEFEDSDEEMGDDELLGNLPSARRRLKRINGVSVVGAKRKASGKPIPPNKDSYSPPRRVPPPSTSPEPLPAHSIPDGDSSRHYHKPVSMLVDSCPPSQEMIAEAGPAEQSRVSPSRLQDVRAGASENEANHAKRETGVGKDRQELSGTKALQEGDVSDQLSRDLQAPRADSAGKEQALTSRLPDLERSDRSFPAKLSDAENRKMSISDRPSVNNVSRGFDAEPAESDPRAHHFSMDLPSTALQNGDGSTFDDHGGRVGPSRAKGPHRQDRDSLKAVEQGVVWPSSPGADVKDLARGTPIVLEVDADSAAFRSQEVNDRTASASGKERDMTPNNQRVEAVEQILQSSDTSNPRPDRSGSVKPEDPRDSPRRQEHDERDRDTVDPLPNQPESCLRRHQSKLLPGNSTEDANELPTDPYFEFSFAEKRRTLERDENDTDSRPDESGGRHEQAMEDATVREAALSPRGSGSFRGLSDNRDRNLYYPDVTSRLASVGQSGYQQRGELAKIEASGTGAVAFVDGHDSDTVASRQPLSGTGQARSDLSSFKPSAGERPEEQTHRMSIYHDDEMEIESSALASKPDGPLLQPDHTDAHRAKQGSYPGAPLDIPSFKRGAGEQDESQSRLSIVPNHDEMDIDNDDQASKVDRPLLQPDGEDTDGPKQASHMGLKTPSNAVFAKGTESTGQGTAASERSLPVTLRADVGYRSIQSEDTARETCDEHLATEDGPGLAQKVASLGGGIDEMHDDGDAEFATRIASRSEGGGGETTDKRPVEAPSGSTGDGIADTPAPMDVVVSERSKECSTKHEKMSAAVDSRPESELAEFEPVAGQGIKTSERRVRLDFANQDPSNTNMKNDSSRLGRIREPSSSPSRGVEPPESSSGDLHAQRSPALDDSPLSPTSGHRRAAPVGPSMDVDGNAGSAMDASHGVASKEAFSSPMLAADVAEEGSESRIGTAAKPNPLKSTLSKLPRSQAPTADESEVQADAKSVPEEKSMARSERSQDATKISFGGVPRDEDAKKSEYMKHADGVTDPPPFIRIPALLVSSSGAKPEAEPAPAGYREEDTDHAVPTSGKVKQAELQEEVATEESKDKSDVTAKEDSHSASASDPDSKATRNIAKRGEAGDTGEGRTVGKLTIKLPVGGTGGSATLSTAGDKPDSCGDPAKAEETE